MRGSSLVSSCLLILSIRLAICGRTDLSDDKIDILEAATISAHKAESVDAVKEIPSLSDAISSVTSWWSKTPECSAAVQAFNPATALMEVGTYLNPFTWIMSFHNVMEIDSELDDLEELDNEVKPDSTQKKSLNTAAFLENLAMMPSEVAAEMWVQWAKDAGYTHIEFIEWLRTSFADTYQQQEMPSGFKAFVQALYDMGIWSPAEKRQLRLLKGDTSFLSGGHGTAPVFPQEGNLDTMDSVDPVFRDDEGDVVGVRSRTSMFKDPFWRNKLLEAMWPHKDHIGGYMIRTALGKVGHDKFSATVKGENLAINKKLMMQNTRYNAYSDKPVLAWEEVDDALMDKLWEEASDMFRELKGVKPDEEYIVAFTFRGMKAGGLLDRSGKGLPGAIWHKDVFADSVAIIYPFCFLPGYNNELTSTKIYEKADPGSKHLAKFREPVEKSVYVQTVPEGESAGFGEAVAFNNQLTRHRAWPPQNASRESIYEAQQNAKDWGVPGDAVRAMIHITIRRKSWTDLGEHIAYTLPDVVGRWIGPVVKCLTQVPFVEQWWFNEYGGFIDRNDRKWFFF